MDLSNIKKSPLTFSQWLKMNNFPPDDTYYENYSKYLREWYSKKIPFLTTPQKEQYKQFLKDLNYLFNKSEKNQFLNNIDFDNDEELIYAIPFFIKKIKEISKVMLKKRESAKKAKLKFNLIGSNEGLEKILYEYILNSFTKKNNITQIPALELQEVLPELSSVKDDFFIEIEELYADKDYNDGAENEEEILNFIQYGLFQKFSNNPLSLLFQTTLEEFDFDTTDYLNAISKKYLSENVYYASSYNSQNEQISNFSFSLNILNGNNWFLWPSGIKINIDRFNNIYNPILINDSNFLNSGATAGLTYTESDLIFTDKNGIIEGAWLQGDKIYPSKGTMDFEILGLNEKSFIYPFCGFSINPNGKTFNNYVLNNFFNRDFEYLDIVDKESIINSYFTRTLPNSSANTIFLNETTLVGNGAYAGTDYTNSDTISKISNYLNTNSSIYNNRFDEIEHVFLYRPVKTDIPITSDLTLIQWPFNIGEDFPVDLKNKNITTPIELKTISHTSMVGAIAGFNFSDSDVIFKLEDKNSEPVEAAFLKAISIENLDKNVDSISVYDTDAIKCADYVNGPIQSSLSFKINAGSKISFIWNDVDTYADEVFKHYAHSDECSYPDNGICTCKSEIFSPIGHSGENVLENGAKADMLFHDPFGLGENFTLNGWKDTRNLTIKNSPQFSYFKLESGDNSIGTENGFWKTPTNKRMVLKTGQRYTYSRANIGENSPFYVVKYPYKKISGNCNISTKVDLCIILDFSKSMTRDITTLKSITTNLYKTILGLNSRGNDTQVSIITFGDNAALVSYLTKDLFSLDLAFRTNQPPKAYPDYTTNIYNALYLSNMILTTQIPSLDDPSINFRDICRDLNFYIEQNNASSIRRLNSPNPESLKKILIFSDGDVTEKSTVSDILNYKNILAENNIELISVAVGPNSLNNNLMKDLASSVNSFYDLHLFLNSNVNADTNEFIQYVLSKIQNSATCGSIYPKWAKAIKNANGEWIDSGEFSEMVLNAGEYFAYIHREGVDYDSENGLFTTPAIDFTINAKLNGWDYDTNTFSLTSIGEKFGGKPFWADAYSVESDENKFFKETNIFGGHIRFVSNYVPISQPTFSNLTLENGNFLTYKRVSEKKLNWSQPLDFTVNETINRWKKLIFSKKISNLEDLLNNNKFDKSVIQSEIDSTILLEGFSQFKPAKYNYFARSPFTYTERLVPLFSNCENEDLNSFSIILSDIYIEPIFPYANLQNSFDPIINTYQSKTNLYSGKKYGEFLIPKNIGKSSYLGRGYEYEISKEKINLMLSLSSDPIFYDLEKYGNRNRGNTKKDNMTVAKLKRLDNNWFTNPNYCSDFSGIPSSPQKYQKMIPYHSSFESTGIYQYGLSKPTDIKQLWNPIYPDAKWIDINYPEDSRGILTYENYESKISEFLIDVGIISNWKTDIFGNEFALYKS